MCFGIVASGTLRRFSRPPLVISAVSSGASSCTASVLPLADDLDPPDAAAGGSGAAARVTGGARRESDADDAAACAPPRGVIATALRADGELARSLGVRALRVAEVVEPDTRSCWLSDWPRRSSTGRAYTRGSVRSRSPCSRASISRENER